MSKKRKPPKRDYYWRRKHMRYVTVPAPVTPTTQDKKPLKMRDEDNNLTEMGEVSMHRYLMTFIVNETVKPPTREEPNPDAKIGKGREGNKRITRLDNAFENAKPGDVVAVEEADWEKVKKIAEEKNWSPASFGAFFTPFEDAWFDAPEKKPEPKKESAPVDSAA